MVGVVIDTVVYVLLGRIGADPGDDFTIDGVIDAGLLDRGGWLHVRKSDSPTRHRIDYVRSVRER